MNYLAHIHLAHHSHSCLLGNLLGDFIKGQPDRRFSPDTIQGIQLHRQVDAYTDAHPLISVLKNCFPKSQRRFAPIVLDIFWDHCLSLQWSRFESMPLAVFGDYARQQIQRSEQPVWSALPERYIDISRRMWQKHWLVSYGHWDNICFAIERVAQRRPAFHSLVACIPTLEKEFALFGDVFTRFYPDILSYAATQTDVAQNPVNSIQRR